MKVNLRHFEISHKTEVTPHSARLCFITSSYVWTWLEMNVKKVLVCTHLFAAHSLCMTWISQEHLPFTFSIGLNSLVQNQLLTASPGKGPKQRIFSSVQEVQILFVCVWLVLQEVSVLVCAKLSSCTQFQLASGFIVEDSVRYNECHSYTASTCGLWERSKHVYAVLRGVVWVLQTVRVIQQDDSYSYWMRQRSVIPSVHPSFPLCGEGKPREREEEWIGIPERHHWMIIFSLSYCGCTFIQWKTC